MTVPRISTPQADPPLEASKWQTVGALLDPSELAELFVALENPVYYFMGSIYPFEAFSGQKEEFFKVYDEYINNLKNGKTLDDSLPRRCFTAMIATSVDALYLADVGKGEGILRAITPTIFLQHHKFAYSHLDHEVRSMVYGIDTITWGVQFSYPQLFIDSKTKAICNTAEVSLPNTQLFRQLQRWMRRHTLPTSFEVDDQRVNTAIRIGKACLPWINNHPQLTAQGLRVIDATSKTPS